MKFTSEQHWILASASPRRKELFSMLGLPFEIVTSDVEETSVTAPTARKYVEEVALLKVRATAKKCPGKTILGADTIVVQDEEILHKPTSKDEAIEHLTKLAGSSHSVLTAVAIVTADGQVHSFVEETKVHFQPLSLPLIEAYVATGDPFDKAGGYGIQTHGALLVSHIEGDYNNVVGLPIAKLTANLLSLNLLTI